ncbi:MAG: sodium:calcium antiporter [Solirubrobacteraceae bacterium]
MADPLLVALFAVAAATSLTASWLLVSRLERIGARLGLSEALLGMLAALAGDGPEITSAVTALLGGHARIGAGVVFGSNVFNLAALLGLGAVVSGYVALHRRVVLFEGLTALLIAGIGASVVITGVPVTVGVLLGLAVFIPYATISASPKRGRLARRWREWLAEAVSQEQAELHGALDTSPARLGDVMVAAGALTVVIGASIAMEQAAFTFGARHAVAQIVTGGLVLAVVTSLPNAVSAIYLARRGRGAATLSAALNSNTLNVLAGLLIPAAIVGLGQPSSQTTLITAWYGGFTLAVLALALHGRGLRRIAGSVIAATYVGFVVVVILVA